MEHLQATTGAARAKSQPQRIVDGVTGRIRDGALKPGEKVPSEPELMREYGVSRTVVREAMSRLQAAGLVETRQGVGTFVLAPPATQPLLGIARGDIKLRQLLAMFELRISLEPEAACLAAQRRSEDDLAKMRAALDAFETHRQQGASTLEDDFRFHAQIAAATGNEYFEQVLVGLGTATIAHRAQEMQAGAAQQAGPSPEPRFGEPVASLEPGKDITQREHEAIYDSIRRGDVAGARAAMFMHLNNSRERLRAKAG